MSDVDSVDQIQLKSAQLCTQQPWKSCELRLETEEDRGLKEGCARMSLITTRHDSSHVSELEDFVLGL